MLHASRPPIRRQSEYEPATDTRVTLSDFRKTLARFRGLPTAERRLIIKTAVLFKTAHITLRFQPLDRARASLVRLASRLNARAGTLSELTWAVKAVNRHLPGKHSCLINAVSAEAIARHSGLAVDFRLGAARNGDAMRFHAWLEQEGRIIIGEHEGDFASFH